MREKKQSIENALRSSNSFSSLFALSFPFFRSCHGAGREKRRCEPSRAAEKAAQKRGFEDWFELAIRKAAVVVAAAVKFFHPSFRKRKTRHFFLSLSPKPQHTLKKTPQFFDNGCENCAFLAIAGDRDRLDACTTVEFSGVVSVLKPGASWCAKWLRVEDAAAGCYAISVRPPAEGLPDEVVEELEHRGIDWRGEGR